MFLSFTVLKCFSILRCVEVISNVDINQSGIEKRDLNEKKQPIRALTM